MREYQSVDHGLFIDEEERAAVEAIIAERDALRDEVERLKCALAEAWRPIDGPAPLGEFEVKVRCGMSRDGGIYRFSNGTFIGWWRGGNGMEWRPVAGSSAMEGKEP